jgi:hypothetical protein
VREVPLEEIDGCQLVAEDYLSTNKDLSRPKLYGCTTPAKDINSAAVYP